MSKGIIYGVYWNYWNGHNCLRHFYEMDDAIEWCKQELEKEAENFFDDPEYYVDKKSDRRCLVGYSSEFGKYVIEAIDVY